MSNTVPNAGPPPNNTQAKIHEFEETAKCAANENACDASGQAQLHRPQEETAGLLHQTGEQVANMAQGAIDGVKNTLGMGEHK